MSMPLLFLVVLATAPNESSALAEPDRVTRDFTLANELALKGEQDAAIRLYETLIDQGVRHQDLYLNLGNAYAASKRDVDAILSYERGLRLAPGDGDLKKNLELLRRRVEQRPEKGAPQSESVVVVADAIDPFVAPLPLTIFTWASIAADMVFFTMLFLRRRPSLGKGARFLGVMAVLAAVVFLFSSTVVLGHFVLSRDPRAVIVETSEIKEGPHERFKSTGRVPPGVRVRIIDEDGAFVKVLRQDGTSGWIRAQGLKRV